MIFFIVLSLAIICCCFKVIANKKCWDDAEIGFLIFSVVLCVALVVMLIIICFNHITADAYIEANLERYEFLVYQVKNEVYDNDNDIGKRGLYEQVREWNEDVAFGKKAQRNFWFGIFYPNIYDQFETIDIEKLLNKE